MDRSYDIVLFGATGFTGSLTARYLARAADPAVRWALAGRSQAKLAALRDTLAADQPRCADLPLLPADVTDPGSLREVAGAARVVATTVGPFLSHGEPLVAACASAGTGYVDLTGEPEFVDLMYLRHHARAVETGARLVHCCGFDSVPHDLGTYLTVQQLPEGVPLTVEGFLRASAGFSGGTWHSTVGALARVREAARVHAQRRRAEPRPAGRRVRTLRGAPRHDPAAGGWLLPLPTIDPQVVVRSAAALDRYGPDFGYGHYLVVPRLPMAVGLAAGAAGLLALSQVPPARDWLLRRKPPGEGPSQQQRARSWFRCRYVGRGGGRRVVTEVSGGDPGYGETAKILAESALCLATDELPQTAGQLTPAVAMGNALVDRLGKAGIAFTVAEQ
jgi:short subunit dehydrogenase-like uncharacterized protein